MADDSLMLDQQDDVIEVSIVIPVYRGAQTLPMLVKEIDALTLTSRSPRGRLFRVLEVVLVWDHGPDKSDQVIEDLAREYRWVKPVWLSRNFGQHPATVAGMSAARGEWIVTLDEDGQHNPVEIGGMLDEAYASQVELVYAAPSNRPPHSRLRNVASRATKGVVLRALSGGNVVPFHSFRLIYGEHARAVAAFCGPGVYLDVALAWIIGAVSSAPIAMRTEGRSSTSYNFRRLISHFWRLVLSSGNRPLRIVSGLGLGCSVLGVLYSVVLIFERFSGVTKVPGWTSAIVATLLVGGVTLISLGVIAEYLGMAASMSMGKPLFVATSGRFVDRRSSRSSE